jgi:signal transduction histidine kinase
MSGFKKDITSSFNSQLGKRIFLVLIIISGVITVLKTLLQLSWQYDKEFSEIDQRYHEIKEIHGPLISTTLWEFDVAHLQRELDSLVLLPKVDYLCIKSDVFTFEAGEKLTTNYTEKQFTLTFLSSDGSHSVDIGQMIMQTNNETIYQSLAWQAAYYLVVNSVKTIIVVSLMLLVFNHAVNRRTFEIGHYLRHYNPIEPPKQLTFKKTSWLARRDDELGQLADEVNKLVYGFDYLYRKVHEEKKKLSDFAHISSDWLWEVNEIGELVYCSESMQFSLDIEMDQRSKLITLKPLSSCYQLREYLRHQNDFSHCEETIVVNCITLHLMFKAKAQFKEDKFIGFRGTAINITDLKLTQIELEDLNDNLEHLIAERTFDLKQSLDKLERAQKQLIEQEKLAALGGLVAGVAHEVNTPLGIAVTATSVIKEVIHEANDAFQNQTLTTEQFQSLMERLMTSSTMLEHNISRAAQLVKDFKQTAVDQVSESRSEFNVYQVLCSLMTSLQPETRKISVVPQICGDQSVTMNSLPGILTQVISNLVLNSVNHAFDNQELPQISISYEEDGDDIIFDYQDNGGGVDPSLHQKVFEPFYTSKRGRGGSGLGLNLVFNLINKKLSGELKFESQLGEGVRFIIRVPKNLPLNLEAKES